jgi:signal transduction histidine kinase
MLSAEKYLQRVSLQTVLENEIEEIQAAFPEAVVTEETAIPQVSVQANDMLGSVFRNLLKNAIQHNDKDVPTVTVSATARDGSAIVRVADNGPGVPDDQKAAIFGKGEKGLDSHGTGLGLYLVKTLVDSYDGSIRVGNRDESTHRGGRSETDDGTDQSASASLTDHTEARDGAVFVVELPTVEDE